VARATANSAAANTILIQGVNLTQNTNITNATNLAQAAFDQANTANGGGSITGNISIASTNSAINFVANSSGDNLGYSTIELVPDTNTSLDQYLIIDPTAPGHIHIRAGGQQDSSSADLFLGGETSHFQVGAGQNPSVYVSANNFTWTFFDYGLMKYPVLTFNDIYDAVEAGQRVFISDSTLEAIPANFGEIVTGGGANTVPVWSDGSYWRIG
jgi:hypothetical protein